MAAGNGFASDVLYMSGYAPTTFSYSIESASLYGTSGLPNINDINQGYAGDCFFLASVGEVAYENAQEITSAITDNGNGAYGVRFIIEARPNM